MANNQKTKATKQGCEFTRPCYVDSVTDGGQSWIIGTYTNYLDRASNQYKRSSVLSFEIGKDYVNANTVQYLKAGHKITLYGRVDYFNKGMYSNQTSQKIIVTYLERELDDLTRIKEDSQGNNSQQQGNYQNNYQAPAQPQAPQQQYQQQQQYVQPPQQGMQQQPYYPPQSQPDQGEEVPF